MKRGLSWSNACCACLRQAATFTDDAAISPWPDTDIAKAKTDLQSIQSDLDSLPVQFPDAWPDWIKNTQNAAAFKTLGDHVKGLTAYLDTLKPIRDSWEEWKNKLIDMRAFLDDICKQGEAASH